MIAEMDYRVELEIQRVYLKLDTKCQATIWWRSGKQKAQIDQQIKIPQNSRYFDVRQKLSVNARILFENGRPKQKKTQLLIVLFTQGNQTKLGGKVTLNLGQFLYPQDPKRVFERKMKKSLQSCPDDRSQIEFNIRTRNIETKQSNLNDISFQANDTNSNFGRSTADMTFRPQKQREQQNLRKTNSFQNSTMPVRNQYTSKQKKRNQEKQWEQRKIDTPSWDRSQRSKQQSQNRRQFQNRTQDVSFQQPNNRGGMEFSFNPTQSEREKIGNTSQIIKELKLIAQEKIRANKFLQQENDKLKKQLDQKMEKSSAKSISILNELNSATAQKQQLQKDKNQLLGQMQQLRQDNKRMTFQLTQNNKASNQKLQQRNKIISELNSKLDETDRKASKLQDQLFKRESQMISKEKEYETNQIIKESINREQTQKLRSISFALKQLQTSFQKLFEQKEELRRKYEQCMFRLEKSEEDNLKNTNNIPKLEQELLKQRQKCKILESKFNQKQIVIYEIQNELKQFTLQKELQFKKKDQQISLIRQKFNAACRKIDEVSNGEESMKNTISEKNVKIKKLEQICHELQKTLEEEQLLISKAKQYVNAKQKQILQKEDEINTRDDFIQKCRTYMQAKQKQFETLLKGKQGNNEQINAIKIQLRDKERMLEQYITESHKKQRQFEQMSNVIQKMRERLLECEDTMDQLNRKNDSQEHTLKDLVKKNLQMEIQLNVKDYEIQSLRSVR